MNSIVKSLAVAGQAWLIVMKHYLTFSFLMLFLILYFTYVILYITPLYSFLLNFILLYST